MKKVLTVGVGAIFLTEESLRGLISEIKLPKELISAILESAGKNKAELLKALPKEIISNILEKVDFLAMVQEILNRNEIELKIRLKFRPKKAPGRRKKPHSRAETNPNH